MAIVPSAAFSAEQRARLELRVDQKRLGMIEVIFRGDDIMARLADLKAANIDSLGARVETIHGVQHVSLKSMIRALSFEMNEADLSLRLTLKPPGANSRVAGASASPQASPGGSAMPIARSKAVDAIRPARLRLQFNGNKNGDITVILRGQDILARMSDMTVLGINPALGQQEIIRGENYVSLRSLAPHFYYALDDLALSLRVTAAANLAESNSAIVKPIPTAPTAAPPELARTDAFPVTDQRAILELRVNSENKGESDVILRGEDVLARVKDLQSVGMAAVNGRKETIGGESFVSLRSLAPALMFEVKETDLALDLTLAPEAFGEHVLSGRDYRPAKLEHRQDGSAFVNYALNANNFKAIDAFSEIGVTVKNALLYSSVSRTLNGQILRGLTNVTINDRDRNIRTMIGDRLVNSDFLGGSITMGGLSYFRDFALDPYFIRNPGLNYAGAVSTPSTLDVYSNGRLVRRVPLPPGQFQLNDLPVPTGSNNTRFVVRDAFGRERELGSQFFYFTSGLLKPGLHDFSYNLGSRRDDLANKSWGYDTPVFLGQHRYGFSDSVTAGLRMEGGRGLVSGGPSVSFLLPLGEMELASAASAERGRAGGAAFLGYSYIDRRFSMGSSVKVQSEHYATTSLSSKNARSWLESGVYLAFPVTDLTTVNLRYAFADSAQSGMEHRAQWFTATRLTQNLTFITGTSFDLKGGNRSLGLNAGLSFNLGEVGGSLAYQHGEDKDKGTLDLRKSLPLGPGYGYGLQASNRGDIDSLFQYQTSFGRYEANYSRLDGQQGSRISAAGGMAFIDGSVQFTRPVQDSFALIKVPGLSGIRGYLNNLEVGTTDSKGQLFVPNLLSYYGNNLGISKKDLPFSYNVDVTDKIVSAPYRGGALVEFAAARIQRVLGKTVIESAGKSIIPKHGQMTITGQGQSTDSPLGNDGEFYFENLKSGPYQAQIETKDYTCDFVLQIPPNNDETVELGTLRCLAP
jgi:outer membrane usher protein